MARMRVAGSTAFTVPTAGWVGLQEDVAPARSKSVTKPANTCCLTEATGSSCGSASARRRSVTPACLIVERALLDPGLQFGEVTGRNRDQSLRQRHGVKAFGVGVRSLAPDHAVAGIAGLDAHDVRESTGRQVRIALWRGRLIDESGPRVRGSKEEVAPSGAA